MARPGRVGVVLLQLGTPDAPTPGALRRYLAEFLWDRRVIDLPRPLWWPILHGRVLRTRPRASAKLYEKVWTSEGSPLAVTTNRQASALAEALTARFGGIDVKVAMRYGRPSIRSVLDELQAAGVDRIVAVPLYPQYAGATTGSSLQQLYEELARRRVVLPLRVVPPYYDAPEYITALAEVTRESLGTAECDRYLLSFHGLPERYVRDGDPYRDQCLITGARLTAALDLPPDRVTVTFQSRFGREPWLQPYTDVTLARMRRSQRTRRGGVPRLRRRLPRDDRGDRHDRPRVVRTRRRPGVPPHSLPEYASSLDRRAENTGRAGTGGVGVDRAQGLRGTCLRSRAHTEAAETNGEHGIGRVNPRNSVSPVPSLREPRARGVLVWAVSSLPAATSSRSTPP